MSTIFVPRAAILSLLWSKQGKEGRKKEEEKKGKAVAFFLAGQKKL